MVATFYLGTDRAAWLATMGVPLFVSHRTLADRKTFPRASMRWALDSGGFTELKDRGSWDAVPPDVYVRNVRRFAQEIGNLEWAAPQDWMCEPSMLAKTGLSLDQHQLLTVHNFVHLRNIAGDLPIIPVVQGWERDDYWACVSLYERCGIDLTREPRVGIGSVCRRNSDAEIGAIVRELTDYGIRCHGFGIRGAAFGQLAHVLASADSMAWSYTARRADGPMRGCTHRKCNHCPRYARHWRERVLAGVHPELWDSA